MKIFSLKTNKILILILCNYISIFAANVYKGQVLDANTDQPLIGVNIFFANTSIGTTSDKDGYFKIENPDSIHTNLIFQHIGYILTERNPGKSSKIFITINLRPTSVEFEPIFVTSKKNWFQKYQRQNKLKIFLDKFYLNKEISNKYCKIINTKYLHFDYNDPEYKVSCDTLIIVKNEYLGYNKKIALKKFHWIKSGNHFILKWEYFINYEELKANNKRQINQWNQNREYIYKGTFRHLIKTIISQKTSSNDFKIYTSKKVRRGGTNNYRNSFDTEFIISTTHKLQKSNYKSLNFSEVFSVNKKENNYVINYLLDHEYLIVEYRNRIKCFIKLSTDKMYCDKFGNLTNNKYIMVGGDWQKYGIESILPLDFVPDK